MNAYRLSPKTHIGHVTLLVPERQAALDFYAGLIGFQEIKRQDDRDYLSASGSPPVQIVLIAKPGARQKPPRTTGLYHTAIRFPDRRSLSQVFRRLAEASYRFQGFADHGVSEAIYLADPFGNGVELYADRPRDQWTWQNGQVTMVTEPLDIDSLLTESAREPAEWKGIHPGIDIGHIHVQVSDLSRAEAFYHGLIGLDVTQQNYPGALFFSAGGYHHHLGVNTWAGQGASQPPQDSIGLRSFSLHIPEAASWYELLIRVEQSGVSLEGWLYYDRRLSFMIRDPDLNAVEIGVDPGALSTEIRQELADRGVDLHEVEGSY